MSVRPGGPDRRLSRCLVAGHKTVQLLDQTAMAGGFVAPTARFGVGSQRLRIGALCGKNGPEGAFRAEVRAVLADVGVGASALRRGPQAVPTSEARLDDGQFLPVAGHRQRRCCWDNRTKALFS